MIRKREVLCGAVGVALALCTLAGAAADEPRAVVVHVRRDCRQGRSVTVGDSKTPTNTLLDDLNAEFGARGRPARLNVIGHRGATVEDLTNLNGFASKVGFETVRYYWVDESTGRMIELRFEGPAFPTTSTPP